MNIRNLQNLPSTGSIYAKTIKTCFKPPEGWLLLSADFSSLEDRISALTTKDTNKLKVYEEGYCGHSLRARYYFKDQMPDINLATDGQKCYIAKVGDDIIYFKEYDEIQYQNQLLKGKDLYEQFCKKNDGC